MLTREQVATRLDRFQSIFSDAHLGAVARLKKVASDSPAVVAALNSTERANLLHGQIRDLVSVGIEETSGATVTEWDIFTLAIGSDLLVRFKYLGSGVPANVATEQQRLLARQRYTEETMAVLTLSGIEKPPTIVTCGYTLDGLDLSKVTIRRDCKWHEPWMYNIYGDEVAVEPLTLPGVEEAKPAVVRSKRVRAEPDAGLDSGVEQG